MSTATDFRIRRNGNQFWVWQTEDGKRFVRINTPHPSRSAAVAWVAGVTR